MNGSVPFVCGNNTPQWHLRPAPTATTAKDSLEHVTNAACWAPTPVSHSDNNKHKNRGARLAWVQDKSPSVFHIIISIILSAIKNESHAVFYLKKKIFFFTGIRRITRISWIFWNHTSLKMKMSVIWEFWLLDQLVLENPASSTLLIVFYKAE